MWMSLSSLSPLLFFVNWLSRKPLVLVWKSLSVVFQHPTLTKKRLIGWLLYWLNCCVDWRRKEQQQSLKELQQLPRHSSLQRLAERFSRTTPECSYAFLRRTCTSKFSKIPKIHLHCNCYILSHSPHHNFFNSCRIWILQKTKLLQISRRNSPCKFERDRTRTRRVTSRIVKFRSFHCYNIPTFFRCTTEVISRRSPSGFPRNLEGSSTTYW